MKSCFPSTGHNNNREKLKNICSKIFEYLLLMSVTFSRSPINGHDWQEKQKSTNVIMNKVIDGMISSSNESIKVKSYDNVLLQALIGQIR